MKRLFTLLLLLVAVSATYAQKRYVTMTAVRGYSNVVGSIYFGGAVPNSIEDVKSLSSSSYDYQVGIYLNLLSDEGFAVENVVSHSNSANNCAYTTYLLSKPAETPQPSDAIKKVTDDDAEIREVARFNLQGLPVSKKEKGIQIIVFSNYTTKTVIVE